MNMHYSSKCRDDDRSREITVAAHCLLNPLTRVRGLAPLTFRPEGPVVQLPCPEALYLGLARWAVTRNQLDVPQFRRFCRALIEQYVDLLEMLVHEGARLRIVGVAGSPSCGVATTSSGYTGGRVRETDCKPGFRKFDLMAVIDLHIILG